MAKRKIYCVYNEMSQQIDSKYLILANNDDEALYRHAITIDQQKQENKYFREQDFKLMCLGVLELEGEKAGIIYEAEPDYPVKFDKIPNFWKPKNETPNINNITVKDENEKLQIIKKAQGE